MSNELIERIAKAMYDTVAHTVAWDQAIEPHRDMWRKQARAAVEELIAIQNVRTAFPQAEVIG